MLNLSCDNNDINNDIKQLLNFIYDMFNTYIKQTTIRNRSTNFKDIFYFIYKYNSNSNSSYNKTIISIQNNNELINDVTYQSYNNKRNKLDIKYFNEINDKLLTFFYKNINVDNKINNNQLRYIAIDGSQLNFLESLKDHFYLNKHNNYTYANLSCLFDVDNLIPINYNISKNDERTIMIDQLKFLNSNDVLIADRGYYSQFTIDKIIENKINFVFRISKHNKIYINNKVAIEKLKEGKIDIININGKTYNLSLFWYSTRNDATSKLELEKINLLIEKTKHNLEQLNKLINEKTIKSKEIFIENKNINLKLKNNEKTIKNKEILAENKNIKPKDKDKIIKNTEILKENKNLKLKKNKKNIIETQLKEDLFNKRKLRNEIKEELINLNDRKIKIENELTSYYNEKKILELNSKSDYYILTNLNSKSISEIKEIYKKRWTVETHFKFTKEQFKFDSMYNKNINFINQNIFITQFIFILESYLENILKKYMLKNNTVKLNKSVIFESLKNKLFSLIINYNKNKNSKESTLEIIRLLLKLIKFVIKKISTVEYKPRLRKRPQKNHYNSNTS